MQFATYYLIDTWITNNLFRALESGSTESHPKWRLLSKACAKYSRNVELTSTQLPFQGSAHSNL